MEPDEIELLAELRALQFTVDKIVVSLKALTDLTEPGGAVHESQRQAAEMTKVWGAFMQKQP